jgi:hypothetical protein
MPDSDSSLAPAPLLRQGVRVDQGPPIAPMRLVHGPVVDAAEPFEEQGETAELPSDAVVRLEVFRLGGPERLVPSPDAGLAGWGARFRDVIRHCGVPVLLAAAVTAGPLQVFATRVSDLLFAVPLLSGALGHAGLFLLPLVWVAYLAMAALPPVLCLALTVALVVGWSSDGALPGPRGVVRLVGHRVGLLWVWFAGWGAVSQVLPLLVADPVAAPRLAFALSAGLAVLSTGVTALTGLLGCVVLVERGRGPRRARRLLAGIPPAVLPVQVLASAGPAVLPSLADAAFGTVAAAATAIVGAVLWSVTSLLTYAQARRRHGPVTSAALAGELAY